MAGKSPVDWPLWRRLRFFGGIGAGCAIIVVAVLFLTGDAGSGRTVNQYSTAGWMPLGPYARALGAGIIASGLLIGACLPIYRYRFGGALLGVAVYLLIVVSVWLLAANRGGPVESDGPWQATIIFVGLGVMAALLGLEARALALGEPEELSSESPPVT